MKPDKPHDSMRGHFAWHLYDEMQANKDIVLICLGLGYGMFDAIRNDMPEQFFEVGASEQAGMGIAVGLALEGKIPLVYSITPFLLWRAAETIRLYLNHESIPVKLVGSGRDTDYEHDGFSHDATDANDLLRLWPNIETYWPTDKLDIALYMVAILNNKKPSFISLRRKW